MPNLGDLEHAMWQLHTTCHLRAAQGGGGSPMGNPLPKAKTLQNYISIRVISNLPHRRGQTWVLEVGKHSHTCENLWHLWFSKIWMDNKHKKRCQLSGKYNLKQMHEIASCISDYQKGKWEFKPPNANWCPWECGETGTLSYTADWNINWYNYLGK